VDGWRDGQMDGYLDGWMEEWLFGWMFVIKVSFIFRNNKEGIQFTHKIV